MSVSTAGQAMLEHVVIACCAMLIRVPFFVAAPVTTVDLDVADGAGIPIEQRAEEELTHVRGQRVVTDGIDVRCQHVLPIS